MKEVQIPKDKVEIIESKSGLNYIEYAASKLETEVIISMGKLPTELFLLLKSSEKFGDYVGKSFERVIKDKTVKIIPALDAGYILNHGKSEMDSIYDCLQLARKEIFG